LDDVADEARNSFESFERRRNDIGTSKMKLHLYLTRMINGVNRWFYDDLTIDIAGVRALLVSLIYLTKIKKLEPNFRLNLINVHPLFAVMMLVASKFSEDEMILNKYWSIVSGIPL